MKTNANMGGYSVNRHFCQLPESYLFSEVARRVATYKVANPTKRVISLGIGDVTRPLVPAVVAAMHAAVDEMAHTDTFRGYGPEQGYSFLRETIVKHCYEKRGVHISPDEVFISDGAKSDIGNIGDILGRDNRVAITDPVYPVYVDSNVMAGRAGQLQPNGQWSNLIYLPCTAENNFVPQLPSERPDVLYLCYPNNPTGTALTKTELKKWVDYALENDVLILFDAAYEAFIRQDDVPHSIYEIREAQRCAIEFRSFSKTAGFTGLRCGYTIVPKQLKGISTDGGSVSLNRLWNRRQCTKFNGTAYVVQRAAEAIFSAQGSKQVMADIDYYMANATLIRQGLEQVGLQAYGGKNAPYVWLQTPHGTNSWSFFDMLLHQCQLVGTPGVGFGPSGEGYFRLTAFGKHEDSMEAMERLKNLL